MTWYFPLKNWQGEIPQGDHPGSFGARRKYDFHTGIDLYVPGNQIVYAVETGVLLNVEDFTGPDAGYPWWLPTQSILIEGESGVVCYGEILPDKRLKLGNTVFSGQRIAQVVPVLKEGKERPDIPGHSRHMLHVELYKPGTVESGLWHLDRSQPKNLLDPTEKLLEAYHGS
jgi:hypothetical protein